MKYLFPALLVAGGFLLPQPEVGEAESAGSGSQLLGGPKVSSEVSAENRRQSLALARQFAETAMEKKAPADSKEAQRYYEEALKNSAPDTLESLRIACEYGEFLLNAFNDAHAVETLNRVIKCPVDRIVKTELGDLEKFSKGGLRESYPKGSDDQVRLAQQRIDAEANEIRKEINYIRRPVMRELAARTFRLNGVQGLKKLLVSYSDDPEMRKVLQTFIAEVMSVDAK